MAVGGINVSQPIVGTSPPVAGQQAGSVAPSGGLVEDGLPRTAAIATGVAHNVYVANEATNAAATTVAGQQVVDPASVQGSTLSQGAAPSGPAAWSEQWATKFKDAGAPSEVIQQLTFTGAMGADEAQLQAMLDQVAGEVDTQITKFAQEHPDEFGKLRANPAVDRAMMVQFASAVNGGQIPAEQLGPLADSVGKSPGAAMFDSTVKPLIGSFAAYALLPGYGLFNLLAIPFNGGVDPLAGHSMIDSPMAIAGTALTASGGAWTIANNVRVARQVSQGQRMIAAGGDAAIVAGHEGYGALSTSQKVASYIPGTRANKVLAGISRLDDIKAGISQLSGTERKLAQATYDKFLSGETSLLGDPASKWGMMGYQPSTRGILLGRNKPAVTTGIDGAKPFVAFESRATGPGIAAHLAAAGVEHADDTAANGMLKTTLFQGLDPTNAAALKQVRAGVLSRASTQLLDTGTIARPQGLQKLFGTVRPGPLQDALWAADNLAAGTVGKSHGTAALREGIAAMPKSLKFGIPALLAAGAGIFMMTRQPKAAEADAAAPADAAAAAGTQTQMTPQLQAALDQFAALPKEQQTQLIQEQQATLEQASQQPNLTAEQQQQIAASASELELYVQVANGGGAATTTDAATAASGAAITTEQPAPAPAAPAAPAATAPGTPAFTSQGLGLS